MDKFLKPLVLGLLLVGAALAVFMEKSGSGPASGDFDGGLIQASDFGKIARIELSDKTASIELVKSEAGIWQLPQDDDFPASAQKVAGFLDKFSRLGLVRVISTKKEAWSKLGIGEEHPLRFSGEGFERLIHLGNERAGGGQYLATPPSFTSYLVDKTLSLPLKLEDWWYRDLISIARDQIKSVVYREGLSSELRLSREDAKAPLKINGSEDLKPGKDQRPLAILNGVRFEAKAKRSKAFDRKLAKAPWLRVETFAGPSYRLKAFKMKAPGAEDEKYFFYLETEDPSLQSLGSLMKVWQFQISDYQGEAMVLTLKDFKS